MAYSPQEEKRAVFQAFLVPARAQEGEKEPVQGLFRRHIRR
jgi:hypothetical protein